MREKMDNKSGNIAVALAYNVKADDAPRVIAKGSGFTAEKIIEIAVSHDIPVKIDKNLTHLLYQVSLDKAIPPSLFRMVAEVLAWVYSIDSDKGKHKNELGGLHG
jgi:flagellar biosynthesis protein